MSSLFFNLNPKQYQAVTSDSQYIRVIAGAGSGKTRVLVARIYHLISQKNYCADQILALTFTKKAANEIKQRLSGYLPGIAGLATGTFHSIANQILRSHCHLLGYSSNFQIIDGQDQLALIKKIRKESQVIDQYIKDQFIVKFINNQKESIKKPDDLDCSDCPNHDDGFIAIYDLYQKYCFENQLIDFADLLLLVYELLTKNKDILNFYQNKFRAILIDEFQDTNLLQFELIKILMNEKNQLFVVGDEDQLIYSWRGAKIENILNLQTTFPNLETITLEQNYRSNQTILSAANYLIANNSQRLGKDLWSEQEVGEKIAIYRADNQIDEAEFVANQIQQFHQNGGNYQDCAILYRNNIQSSKIELIFNKYNIPFVIYGGTAFFSRLEIKLVIYYLRFIYLRDDFSLEKIINFPARKIGEKLWKKLQEVARDNQSSITGVLWNVDKYSAFTKAQVNALKGFVVLIDDIYNNLVDDCLKTNLEKIINQSGLYDYFESLDQKENTNRLENLDELLNMAVDFNEQEKNIDGFIDFLNNKILEMPNKSADFQNSVQLMTIHSAKGLEFDRVFLVGMEQGVFPSVNSFNDSSILEEERRLMYVAITRAKQQLIISYSANKYSYNHQAPVQKSQFLNEIPAKCLYFINDLNQYFEQGDCFIGKRVFHSRYGEGVIVNLSGKPNDLRGLVNFDDYGEKWMLCSSLCFD